MKAISFARRLAAAAPLSTAMFAAFLTIGAAAQAAQMEDLVRETQQMAQEASQLTFVWWIPQEFWEASLAANPKVTPAARTELLAALDDFQIVALFRAKTGIGGFSEVPSKEDLFANAHFESNGKPIEPLDPQKISVAAQTVLATIKPLLSGMLGQLGQGMQLVVYPSKQNGQRLIDPKKPGSFQYTLFDQTFKWRLPLGSLLPKKVDPKTKEEFPGNYAFNPYTGGKLTSK
jgi:hypothetical protein